MKKGENGSLHGFRLCFHKLNKNASRNDSFDMSTHGIMKFNSAKDEGLGACAQTRVRRRIFSLFPMMVGSQVMKLVTKNTIFLFEAVSNVI